MYFLVYTLAYIELWLLASVTRYACLAWVYGVNMYPYENTLCTCLCSLPTTQSFVVKVFFFYATQHWKRGLGKMKPSRLYSTKQLTSEMRTTPLIMNWFPWAPITTMCLVRYFFFILISGSSTEITSQLCNNNIMEE